MNIDLLAHDSTDEAGGILPTERPQRLESPARIPEESLGRENIYEPHDVNMGIIDDYGAEVFFFFLFAVTKAAFRGLPRPKRV